MVEVFLEYSKPKIMNPKSSLLRHVVLFKFRDSSSEDEVKQVVSSFMSLKNQVPQIVAMEWGKNISEENNHQGFTHCFVISFRSIQDLTDYQSHPAHLDFQQVLGPHMEKVFVVDYYSND
jgi:NADPH-dependent 7-cyano-7-deazaguanine reductase QueF